MRFIDNRLGRRPFLASAATVAGVAALRPAPARAAAKYTRYNVTSDEGQKMLGIYRAGVEAMLNKPPEHPHNWFRNAFVHLMDCPHGNWWFFTWHRGFIGLLEQTIRTVTKEPNFTLPFWDWTELPRIPGGMFDGVLDPTNAAYLPFTKDLDTFTKFIKKPMSAYWDTLTPAQRKQQADRGNKTFEDVWTGMLSPSSPGDQAFAATDRARYLTRQNPALSPDVAADCTPEVVLGGLGATYFYAPDSMKKYQPVLSFNSIRTPNHNTAPGSTTWFSTLEGLPHNNIHNFIGGVGGPWTAPYGNMTNNLSPVDPVFFLHHGNMDRLWDVWSRKQRAYGMSDRPLPADERNFMTEAFRFFVGPDGKYITDTKAADYFSTDVFGYDYAKGTGEELIPKAGLLMAARTKPTQPTMADGVVRGNTAAVTLRQVPAQAQLMVSVTVPRPAQGSTGDGRSFDVLLNLPPGVERVAANSPNYLAKVAFFGKHGAGHMHGKDEATFLVPLSRAKALANAVGGVAKLTISVVPSQGAGPAPALTAVSVTAF